MKTTTYLRLSLLIPFLVWGISLLVFILWSNFQPSGPQSETSTRAMGLMMLPFLFYVFGIIGWFLPYVLLSLILLIWSFRSRAQVLMMVFALSPFAMAILILLFVNILSFSNQDWNLLSSDRAMNAENFFGSNLWFVVLTLAWDYISVGIGFGMYKILQRMGFIKDEAVAASAPLPEPS